jgi:hypothetical protein
MIHGPHLREQTVALKRVRFLDAGGRRVVWVTLELLLPNTRPSESERQTTQHQPTRWLSKPGASIRNCCVSARGGRNPICHHGPQGGEVVRLPSPGRRFGRDQFGTWRFHELSARWGPVEGKGFVVYSWQEHRPRAAAEAG